MRSFLQQYGYAAVGQTIDASDWAINGRMEARRESRPQS